ncbi:hypothetical protein BHF56_23390 [Escherichia coli]|nr:hypothetical protein WQ65_21735 [Escherichia coli]KNG20920.1 hypothetical protein WQ97_20560 [Escherichia coli]OEN79949.1 hypothetical protein BHF56_23390 [Escherichia coli]
MTLAITRRIEFVVFNVSAPYLCQAMFFLAAVWMSSEGHRIVVQRKRYRATRVLFLLKILILINILRMSLRPDVMRLSGYYMGEITLYNF